MKQCYGKLILLWLGCCNSFNTNTFLRQKFVRNRLLVWSSDGENRGNTSKLSENPVLVKRCAAFDVGAISAKDLLNTLEKISIELPTKKLTDVIEVAVKKLRPQKRTQLITLFESRGKSASVLYNGINSVENCIGEKYILVPGSSSISSGKSRIVDCIIRNSSSTRPYLKAKIVNKKGFDTLRREAETYQLVKKSRKFTNFVDYLPNFNAREDSAIILESGEMGDLKELVLNDGPVKFEKLRKISSRVASSLRALHVANMVWTDLKPANFVITGNGEIKGIDLESAVPKGSLCIDFSPEVMPPEVALAFRTNGPTGYLADQSYDVWSLGMTMLYLYLGRSYFGPYTETQIMSEIGQTDFSVDLSVVEDPQLKDVLNGLLQIDPKKRLQYFRRPSWYFRNGIFG